MLNGTNLTELETLARTMWGEARSEGEAGMRAVAHVVMNRVRIARARGGAWWGKTVVGVCTKPFQFSCWNRNDINAAKIRAVSVRDPEFRVAMAIGLRILKGELTFDTTRGATHYHRFDMTPKWARGRESTVRIGAHIFYNLEDEA